MLEGEHAWVLGDPGMPQVQREHTRTVGCRAASRQLMALGASHDVEGSGVHAGCHVRPPPAVVSTHRRHRYHCGGERGQQQCFDTRVCEGKSILA